MVLGAAGAAVTVVGALCGWGVAAVEALSRLPHPAARPLITATAAVARATRNGTSLAQPAKRPMWSPNDCR